MRATVVTRDNSQCLLTTLRGLVSCGVNESNILVVDDSSAESSIKETKDALETTFERPPKHLSWHDQGEVLHWIPMEYRKSVASHFRLAKAGWNTYAARNVGLLWSARLGKCRRVLWVDDDVDVSVSVVGSASRTPPDCISAFALVGLPDFSRTKWLEMYLSCIEPSADFMGTASHAALLHAFTDLYVPLPEAQPSSRSFPLPWNSAHGAAYATNIALGHAPLFPAFQGEDYFWHRRLIDLGKRRIRCRAPVCHRGRRRQLLDAELFVAEELGAIQATCLRFVLSNSNLSVRRTISTLAASRRRDLNLLAGRASRIHANRISQAPILSSIAELLEQVGASLANVCTLESAVETVSQSLAACAVWSRVGPQISQKIA